MFCLCSRGFLLAICLCLDPLCLEYLLLSHTPKMYARIKFKICCGIISLPKLFVLLLVSNWNKRVQWVIIIYPGLIATVLYLLEKYLIWVKDGACIFFICILSTLSTGPAGPNFYCMQEKRKRSKS